MRGAVAAAAVVAVAACGKPADECQRMADKSGPMFAALARDANRAITDDDQAKIVAQCRQALASGHRDPVLDCVLGAVDDVAVRACYLKGLEGPASSPAQSEAKRMLTRLGKHATAYYLARGEFPRGEAPLTPATACCRQADQQCAAPEAAWAALPVWAALAFLVDPPSRFQYRYQSDGATFTATATGDVHCDGHPVTYTIEGSAPGGNPQSHVIEP
jgi:hypothetical protein